MTCDYFLALHTILSTEYVQNWLNRFARDAVFHRVFCFLLDFKPALFLINIKKSFKINALVWSRAACSQSYPHFMCGTGMAVEKYRDARWL